MDARFFLYYRANSDSSCLCSWVRGLRTRPIASLKGSTHIAHQLTRAPPVRLSSLHSLTSPTPLAPPWFQVPSSWIQLPQVMLAVKAPTKMCPLEGAQHHANAVRAMMGTRALCLPRFGTTFRWRSGSVLGPCVLVLDVNHTPGPLHTFRRGAPVC